MAILSLDREINKGRKSHNAVTPENPLHGGQRGFLQISACPGRTKVYAADRNWKTIGGGSDDDVGADRTEFMVYLVAHINGDGRHAVATAMPSVTAIRLRSLRSRRRKRDWLMMRRIMDQSQAA